MKSQILSTLLFVLLAVGQVDVSQGAQQNTGTSPQATKTTQAPPPPPASKKKREKLIDTTSQGGTRGGGNAVTVKVLLKGKPVDGASVVAKNPDGTIADSGWTALSGVCVLNIKEGNYIFSAKQNGIEGTVSAHVTSSTAPLVVRLEKMK